MMHLKRSTFVVAVAVAVAAGVGLGAFTTGRTGTARERRFAQQPLIEAPGIPVQMPLTTNTFSKLAEAIKPTVINVNTVSRVGGRTPRRQLFSEQVFRALFHGTPAGAPPRSPGS